jgi:hypothetical protein
MELRADARIPYPRDVVFAAYRDDIKKLLPYLPNVRSIDVKSRSQKGPIVEIVNEWRGGGEIPSPIRAVLGDSMLAWTDHATWNSEQLRCDWRTESHALAGALRCMGSNVFLEDGPGKTSLEIRGALEIDAGKIRGVPSFLAGKVGRTFEEILGGKIRLNLIETAKGLTAYLGKRSA